MVNLALYVLFLIGGFVLLVKGADALVDGASSLAQRWSVSEIAIGLTIVAFGTSTPELAVNVFASFKGCSGIVFGNIVGSNIANILLILGIAGIIHPIQSEKNTVWKEIPFALLSAVVLLVLSNDLIVNADKNQILSKSDAIILLLFFITFLSYTFGISKIESNDTLDITILSGAKISVYIISGLVGLAVGGKLVVEGSVRIADWFAVSERLVGFTIVAVGTSLPELFTSAVAAYKRKSDIAIGNVVGSNIFNVFFVMGVSAFIAPVHFQSALNIDLLVLMGASLMLFMTMFTGKKRSLDRWEAILFIGCYVSYVVFLLMRR